MHHDRKHQRSSLLYLAVLLIPRTMAIIVMVPYLVSQNCYHDITSSHVLRSSVPVSAEGWLLDLAFFILFFLSFFFSDFLSFFISLFLSFFRNVSG